MEKLQTPSDFEIRYVELFKGRFYNHVLCVANWQIPGVVAKLQKRESVKDVIVCLRLEEN
jgi:hypothetical protein